MPGAALPSSLLEARAGGIITHLAADDRQRLHALMSIGALPGVRITMLQRFPSFVLQLGNSQFALDRHMVEGILVRAES